MPNPPFNKIIGHDEDLADAAPYGQANPGVVSKAEDNLLSKTAREVAGLEDTLEFNRPTNMPGQGPNRVGSHKAINDFGSSASTDSKKYLYPEIVDNSPIRYMITDDDEDSELRRMRPDEAKYIENVNGSTPKSNAAINKQTFGKYESVAQKEDMGDIYLGSSKVASDPSYQAKSTNKDANFVAIDQSSVSYTNDGSLDDSPTEKELPSFKQAALKSKMEDYKTTRGASEEPVHFKSVIGLEDGREIHDQAINVQGATAQGGHKHIPGATFDYEDEGIVYNKAEALGRAKASGGNFNTSNVGKGLNLDDEIVVRQDEKDLHISQIDFKGVFSQVKDLQSPNVVRSQDENVLEVWTDNSHSHKQIQKTTPSPLSRIAQIVTNQVEEDSAPIKDVDGNYINQKLQNFSWNDYFKNSQASNNQANAARMKEVKESVYGTEQSLDPDVNLEQKVSSIQLNEAGDGYQLGYKKVKKDVDPRDEQAIKDITATFIKESATKGQSKIDLDKAISKISESFFTKKDNGQSIEFRQTMKVDQKNPNSVAEPTKPIGEPTKPLHHVDVPTSEVDLNEITKLIFKIKE